MPGKIGEEGEVSSCSCGLAMTSAETWWQVLTKKTLKKSPVFKQNGNFEAIGLV